MRRLLRPLTLICWLLCGLGSAWAGGGGVSALMAANPHQGFDTGSTNPSHRCGFQGEACPERSRRESDDEMYGDGNAIAFTYRVHACPERSRRGPRIGRFLSVDPLAPEYPFYSPYAFSGNRVLDRVELEGLEPVPSPANAKKTKEIVSEHGNNLLGFGGSGPMIELFTSSQGSNFKVDAWWRLGKNMPSNSWNGALGVTGEAIAAIFQLGNLGDVLNQKQLNTNLPFGRIVDFQPHPSNQNKGPDFSITFNSTFRSTITLENHNAAGTLVAQTFIISSTQTINYEVKTLSATLASDIDIILSKILIGYKQSTENAQMYPGSINMLVVDYDAYMKAYAKFPNELNSAYNNLVSNNGGLFLQKGLTKEANDAVSAITARISAETTTDTSH